MADWTWTLDDNPSDLSVPGSNFDKRLLRFAENTGEIAVDVPFNSTETDYFFSDPGEPSSNAWRAGELWRIGIDVTQANIKIKLRVALERVDSAGVVQQTYVPFTGFATLGTLGTRVYSGTTQIQTDPQAGDRLRVRFEWTRNNDFGGDGIIGIGFGDPDNDFVEVPIEMGNSVITWNGNALNFPGPLTRASGLDVPKAKSKVVMSDGKVHATQVTTLFYEPAIELARFDDAEFEFKLHAWWSWALQGNQYAFAVDVNNQVDTTLDGAAASGQKVIPLTSTAGIVVGLKYLIREAAGHNFQLVHVNSISAGISVTARDNLQFSFANADIFRSRRYYPKVVNPKGNPPPPWEENPGLTWTLFHRMKEDAD